MTDKNYRLKPRKACQPGQAFRHYLTLPLRNLEDFGYHYLHNKDREEEPEEKKASDKKQLSPPGR